MRFNVSSFVPPDEEPGSVLTQNSVDLPADALADLRGLRTFETALRSVVAEAAGVTCWGFLGGFGETVAGAGAGAGAEGYIFGCGATAFTGGSVGVRMEFGRA